MRPERMQSRLWELAELPFPKSELVAPKFKKTRKMIEVEQRLGESGEEIGNILRRKYVDELKSLKAIGGEFEVDGTTIHNWISITCPDIKIKGFLDLRKDPKFEALRLERHRIAWANPERRREMIAKVHTPESNALRSRAMKDLLLQDPSKSPILKASDAKRKKLAAKIEEAFGSNPKEKLIEMVRVEQLTLNEIRDRIGKKLSKYSIRKLLKDYKIDITRQKSGKYRSRILRGITKEEIEVRKKMVKEAIETDTLKNLPAQVQRALLALYSEDLGVPTHASVARKFGLSRERIRQLDNKGILRLAAAIK